jgi:L-ascorbate metabolism protein UlaG (beta-lactamase superfamily)
MASLAQTIAQMQVPTGHVMAWWLGGTGFVFKTAAGTQIYVDPYFSNCVAEIFGVERAFPAPISAEEARPDLLIATHWHEDHLDPRGCRSWPGTARLGSWAHRRACRGCSAGGCRAIVWSGLPLGKRRHSET